MAWNDIEEISEAVQNLILKGHALGADLVVSSDGKPAPQSANKQKRGADVSNEEPGRVETRS